MRRAASIAAAVLAALAVAACGDSPEDDAYDDGEQIGESVRALYNAENAEDAGEAIDDLRRVTEEMDDDTRERVQEQVETQRGSLDKAAEAIGSGDPTALKEVAQQMRSQADAFSSTNNSISNAFWRGFEDGYDD